MSKLSDRLILFFAGIFKGFVVLALAGMALVFLIAAYVAVLYLLGPA